MVVQGEKRKSELPLGRRYFGGGPRARFRAKSNVQRRRAQSLNTCFLISFGPFKNYLHAFCACCTQIQTLLLPKCGRLYLNLRRTNCILERTTGAEIQDSFVTSLFSVVDPMCGIQRSGMESIQSRCRSATPPRGETITIPYERDLMSTRCRQCVLINPKLD